MNGKGRGVENQWVREDGSVGKGGEGLMEWLLANF